MASSEIFLPSNGELLVRSSLAHGPTMPTDSFRKEDRRPQTQGGYRFGQLSHHSFFTRHNPHPTRVRHMKGLLDVPICSVNDDGYFASPRYSLQFPPNNFDGQKLMNWKGRIPLNAINFNRQLHPVNTFTGLQQYTGLNSYPFREKAIPRVGLVPVTETWRDELAAFTRALGLNDSDGIKDPDQSKVFEKPHQRATVYSPETGRIIPAPSRVLSRGCSRKGSTSHQFIGGNFQHISAYPDWENVVLIMLCQILQTEDVNAVQAWLCSAGEREKGLVMSLVRSALGGGEEYYRQYPAEFLPDLNKGKLPPIHEKPDSSNGEINRLVLDDNTETEVKKQQNATMNTEYLKDIFTDASTQTMEDEENIKIQPLTKDAGKPASNRKSLMPLLPARLVPASKLKTQIQKKSALQSKLKYSKTH